MSPQNSYVKKPNPQGDEVELREKHSQPAEGHEQRHGDGESWVRKPEGISTGGVGCK